MILELSVIFEFSGTKDLKKVLTTVSLDFLRASPASGSPPFEIKKQTAARAGCLAMASEDIGELHSAS